MRQEENSDKKRKIEIVKDVSVIITCLSLVAGMIIGVSNLVNSRREIRFSGMQEAKEVIKDELVVKDSIASFMYEFSSLNIDSLKKTHKTGRSLYYSPYLSSFKSIAHHYEVVGALVKGHYIDFDLYYNVVSFPADFYNITKDLRAYLKEKWDGEKPLPDFLINFEYLKERFDKKDAEKR